MKKLAASVFVFATSVLSVHGIDIYHEGWIDFNKNGVKDVYEDPSASVEARVSDLVSRMTVEEKTCQLATLYGSGRVLEEAQPSARWKKEIWKDGIGDIDEELNGVGKMYEELKGRPRYIISKRAGRTAEPEIMKRC